MTDILNDVDVDGKITATDDIETSKKLKSTGNADIGGALTVGNGATVTGNITATGDVSDGSGNKISDVTGKRDKISGSHTYDKVYVQSSAGTEGDIDVSASLVNSTIPVRSATGTIKASSPSANDDVATKGYADSIDTGALHKAGAETVTGKKTILADVDIGASGNAKNVTQVGNINLTGDLTIQGNITQNGSSYEAHAQQVFTTDDYITMRDGATGGLSSGSYSGFQIKKYDGTNDGRLVVDNSGTARVGDVGDEQPLMTRAETGSMTNGSLIRWDGTNLKAISNTDSIVKKYSGTSTIATGSWSSSGDATYPYKAQITVNGITANDYPIVTYASAQARSGNFSQECETGANTLTIFAIAVPSASITVSYIVLQDVS